MSTASSPRRSGKNELDATTALRAEGTRRASRSLTLLALLVLLAGPTALSSGCGSRGPLVGAILGDLTHDVNATVQNAGAEARATTLASAAAVQDAINNAESAFAEDLNKAIDKVDENTRGNINRLQAIVADLQKGTQQTIKVAGQDAQQLINTLPFVNRNPQVKRYSPVFVVQGGPPTVQLRIEGNFVEAFRRNFKPLVHVGGQTFEPNLLTTQELGYEIPTGVLPAAPAKQLASVSLELETPYEKGAIFKNQDLGTFRLLVSVLPESPVRSLKLINQVTTEETLQQSLRFPAGDATFDLNSYDCVDHAREESVAATPGWRIIPSSAQNVVTWNKNPNAAHVELNASASAVITKGHTQPACFLWNICNGCGRISWFVTYSEQTIKTITADKELPLSIKWGDRLNVGVTLNRWRLEAEMFDGRVFQVATTDNSSEYLSIQDLGATISVQTPATDAFFAQ